MKSLRVLMVPVLIAGFGLASATVARPVSAQPGPGSNLNAFETRAQSAMVGPDVDTVSSTQSFSGLRTWELSLGNFGSTPAAGAKITVTSGTRVLNDSAQFHWTWQLPTGPNPPGAPVDCSASATEVNCGGPTGSPLGANTGLQAFSSGHPGPGGPGVASTSIRPPFNSARHLVGSHLTVPVTLTDTGFGGANIVVNLPDGFQPSGAQVTTANGPVPDCPMGGPPNGTCAQKNFNSPPNPPCGGGWFLKVNGAQVGTEYTFSADRAACASGKPMVVVSASQFAPGGQPTNGVTSVSQTDTDLQATITYSVSTPNNFGTGIQNQVLIQFQGTGGQPGPGPGGNLNAFETRVQSAMVGPDVDMVASTQSFSGLRTWQLGLGNFGSTAVAGAQITVHSGTRTLNNSSQFHWTWQLFSGPTPPQGSSTECSASATDVSCGGPAGSPLGANSNLQAFSSGNAGPGGVGVPTPVAPPFDSARTQTANHETVTATLTGASFGGGDLQIGLPNGMAQNPAAQVTTASGPVPACPPGAPPNGTCAQANFNQPPNFPCGGGWFLTVHQAQLGTQYTFTADQASCASGKPMVVVGASQFRPPGAPSSGTSVSQTDADLGTITYSVSTANSFNTDVQDQVAVQYQGTGQPGPGPGGNLNAFETRVQSAMVGPDVDMVSSTQSLGGLRTWELGLFNFGTTPVEGAKITVTSSTRALNNSAQFHWTWQLPTGPNPPGPPVDCGASATEVSCGGPAGSPLANGGLRAFSSGHPGPGGPGVQWTVTPPFNSARHLVGSHLTVPVTLTDAGFGGADLMVNLPDGFQASGALVTTANGPVSDCPMGGPPNGTCAQRDFFAPPNSPCGGGWFLNVSGAQVGTEYTFSADRAACASAKPMVMVGAGQFAPGGPPTSGVTSVSQTDTDLQANITYSVDTPNSFGIGVQNQTVIQYQPGITPTPTPTPTWILTPTPTPTWILTPTPTATPMPTTPVLATTGGGASASGHLAALSYFLGWVLFGFGCLLVVRLVKARLRRQ